LLGIRDEIPLLLLVALDPVLFENVLGVPQAYFQLPSNRSHGVDGLGDVREADDDGRYFRVNLSPWLLVLLAGPCSFAGLEI